MKKYHLITLALLVISTSMLAQTEVHKKPMRYLNPSDSLSNIPQTEYLDDLSDFPWYVISDRDDNPVYEASSGNEIKTRVPFGEKLAVIPSVNNGSRLWVAKETDISGRILPADSQPIGWMDADKLLLWDKCLANKEYNIDKKAMILFNLEAATIQHNETGKVTTDVPIYTSPSSDSTFFLTYHRGKFEFFPIYKTQGRYLLIGQSFKLKEQKEFTTGKNAYTGNYGLIGWVNSQNVSQWSHRLAWEKNWKQAAVAERMENKDSVGIMVLATPGEAETYALTNRKLSSQAFSPTNTAPYQELKITNKRVRGPESRFPILDIKKVTSDSGVSEMEPVKVGVIGEIKIGDTTLSGEDLQELADKAEVLKNVNIIFVIDATESMVDYKTPVKNGIKNALKSIDEFYTKNNKNQVKTQLKFGCVLYRDYHMQYTTQTFASASTTDTARFFVWLDSNFTKDMNKVRRKEARGKDDAEEAMFYGMQQALYDYNPDPGESNYMILLGDCGDHLQDKDTTGYMNLKIEQDSLIADFSFWNMNLLAFQVHYNNPKQYKANEKFQDQLTGFISNLGNDEMRANKTDPNLLELPKGNSVRGKLLKCAKGSKIDTSNMRMIISDQIEQINKDVNEFIKNILYITDLQGVEDGWATGKAIAWGINEGIDSETMAKLATEGGIQEYDTGYTVLRCRDYDYDNFVQVVLLEQKELEEVVFAFRDLSAAKKYTSSRKRERLEHALNEWFPKYFSGVEDSVLKDMEVGKLLHELTGQDIGKKYKSITISKIIDPIRVSNKEIDVFVDDISISLAKLEKNVYNPTTPYPGTVRGRGINPTIMYYIPADHFPQK